MKYRNLHTTALIKIYGPIKGQIIRQDEKVRIVHMQDGKGISRTLAIVRFGNIRTRSLKKTHQQILNGSLLGQTLYDSDIPFNKHYIGNHSIQLPLWLMKDFRTRETEGLAMFSTIHVEGATSKSEKFLYAEIIEIVPPYLVDTYRSKTLPLHEIDQNMLGLLEDAELMVNPANTNR